MFDLQQRWYGIENFDKDGSLHEQMYEGLDGVYWLENNGHFLILIRE